MPKLKKNVRKRDPKWSSHLPTGGGVTWYEKSAVALATAEGRANSEVMEDVCNVLLHLVVDGVLHDVVCSLSQTAAAASSGAAQSSMVAVSVDSVYEKTITTLFQNAGYGGTLLWGRFVAVAAAAASAAAAAQSAAAAPVTSPSDDIVECFTKFVQEVILQMLQSHPQLFTLDSTASNVTPLAQS